MAFNEGSGEFAQQWTPVTGRFTVFVAESRHSGEVHATWRKKTRMSKLHIVAAALVVATILGVASDASAQGACLSRRDARRLLDSREVVPLADALNRAGVRRQEVIPDGVELCGRPGNFVYRFRTLRGGRVDRREIPAR